MAKNFVTAHTIVKNEDKFIWFALTSVLPHVDRLLIYDTGSSDRTVGIIKSLRDPKITFEERGQQTPADLVKLRQEQIDRTDTDFFLLLDGDEIWPRKNLLKLLEALKILPPGKVAVYCRTRNAVGDIYHYLPEDAGRYEFSGRRGHLTLRAFRKDAYLTVGGFYPFETYYFSGRSLNTWDEKLEFCDTWYLHATHLERSSSSIKTLGFRSQKIEKGIAFDPSELPEVLKEAKLPRRSRLFDMVANIITPFKVWRRTHAKI